ncbi:MAG: GTPase [Nanobdellota archaeon]
MNFQYIKKVESSQQIIDVALNSARKSAEETWLKYKRTNKIDRLKVTERRRILNSSRIMQRRLSKILDQFPIIDNLPVIYRELSKNSFDYYKYKKSIYSLKWAMKKIDDLAKYFDRILSKAEKQKEITDCRKSFYARSSSILGKNQKYMEFLESARKLMKRFPDLKEDFFTVAIAGFPNVGKSSILKAITMSNPQIAEYPFTTKGLNVGLIKDYKIQLVDVPGTLDRTKVNIIEKNAHLVLENLAEMILFVIDPSSTSGYTVNEQIKLLEKTKNKVDAVFYIVFSKIDIAEKKTLEKLSQIYPDAEFVSVIEGSVENLKNLVIEEKSKKIANLSSSF